MAVTPGLSGVGGVPSNDVTWDLMFTVPEGEVTPSTIVVRNASGATAAADVRIPQLHGDDAFATIPAGSSERFEFKYGELREAFVRKTGAIVDWYPVALTKA